MLTVSERQDEELSLSVLKFWQENGSLSYDVNTRIEYAHGAHVNGARGFYSVKERAFKFLTFGADNQFKVWKKYARKQPNSKSGET